jgi:hypothetical protein
MRIAGVVCAAGALAVLAGCGGEETGSKGDSKASAESAVLEACRDAVRDELKAPATADFSEETAEETSTAFTWAAAGAVDAENSFGAKIRSRWVCTARDRGGDWDADVTISK